MAMKGLRSEVPAHYRVPMSLASECPQKRNNPLLGGICLLTTGGLVRVSRNLCRVFYSVKHVWETCVDNVALELATDLLHNPPRRLVGH
jgi:hypothetical protein